MSYYQLHKQERLEYQKEYNKGENYKTYQQEYFQRNKQKIMEQHRLRLQKNKPKKEKPSKPLPKYKLNAIEMVLRRKLNDYYDTMYQLDVAKKIVGNGNEMPLTNIVMRNSSFVLMFD
jgi:hypothetical protein